MIVFAVLDGAEQAELQGVGELRYFVEEDRPPLRLAEFMCPGGGKVALRIASIGTVEGKLAFRRGFAKRKAIDDDKRPVRPVAEAVDRSSQERLAGPSIAENQHRRHRRRDRSRQFNGLPQGCVGADHSQVTGLIIGSRGRGGQRLTVQGMLSLEASMRRGRALIDRRRRHLPRHRRGLRLLLMRRLRGVEAR